jgi:predicted CXXCH cytochrome family protein
MKRRQIVITFFFLLCSASLMGWAIAESDIIFSHKFHVVEQEVECAACHIDIESSSAAADRNLPTMDECGACHDVEDDEQCGICHTDPEEPYPIPDVERTTEFNHSRHLADGVACKRCHEQIINSEGPALSRMPEMAVCMDCHDGSTADDACSLCHGDQQTPLTYHAGDWLHQHGDRAAIDKNSCGSCHRNERSCLNCHRGDNLSGIIHELNYAYTHGLDARSKETDCRKCHDTRRFCNDCHVRELRMPLNHSTQMWNVGHAAAARDDIENCASCHDSSDPTCARIGCHNDFDGLRGSDPVIHDPDANRFDSEGDWHEDNGSFCYQCHTNTESPGDGFCGYCH